MIGANESRTVSSYSSQCSSDQISFSSGLELGQATTIARCYADSRSERLTDKQAGEDAVDPRIDLAVKRTELAWDRTLLAWLRTTSTLIAAGFAFDKGTQWLHEARLAAGTALVRSGHLVGLSLTASSITLLIFVSVQYWRGMRELAAIRGSRVSHLTPPLLANALLVLLGIVLFVVMLPSGS
jgi:putative membrane protein